ADLVTFGGHRAPGRAAPGPRIVMHHGVAHPYVQRVATVYEARCGECGVGADSDRAVGPEDRRPDLGPSRRAPARRRENRVAEPETARFGGMVGAQEVALVVSAPPAPVARDVGLRPLHAPTLDAMCWANISRNGGRRRDVVAIAVRVPGGRASHARPPGRCSGSAD